MHSSLVIRPFEESDLEALYRICLRTMDAGGDATPFFKHAELPGAYYAAPYVIREPGLCLVACLEGRPSGYVLGTADSLAFGAWCEEQWFPSLRDRFPLPGEEDQSRDAAMVRLLHKGYQPHPSVLDYPGHLHIDLLPCLQGRGVGRRLIGGLMGLLRGRGCPALHLGVSEANPGACNFYERVGFELLGKHPGWRAYGRRLE